MGPFLFQICFSFPSSLISYNFNHKYVRLSNSQLIMFWIFMLPQNSSVELLIPNVTVFGSKSIHILYYLEIYTFIYTCTSTVLWDFSLLNIKYLLLSETSLNLLSSTRLPFQSSYSLLFGSDCLFFYDLVLVSCSLPYYFSNIIHLQYLLNAQNYLS